VLERFDLTPEALLQVTGSGVAAAVLQRKATAIVNALHFIASLYHFFIAVRTVKKAD
jgi:hypothetical protein